MSSATLLYSPFTPSKPHLSIRRSRPPKTHLSSSSSFVSRHSSKLFPPFSSSVPLLRSIPQSKRRVIRAAYISAPASDPNLSGIDEEEDPVGHQSQSQTTMVDSSIPISWGYLWSLLMKHKLRLAASIFALVGCTSCTLSMPIFSGRFFEVLIGARPDPLWKLLTKVGVLYCMEPIFTVIFVTNMSTVWEKVMTTLRAQVFRRILIQKIEFFDRYKVGELTGLLTSDLGSLKDAVSENISRDRGLRAFSEDQVSGKVLAKGPKQGRLFPLQISSQESPLQSLLCFLILVIINASCGIIV